MGSSNMTCHIKNFIKQIWSGITGLPYRTAHSYQETEMVFHDKTGTTREGWLVCTKCGHVASVPTYHEFEFRGKK